MQIESITLSGFRSFGPDPISVTLSSEVTAIVGPNGAGKTAFLHALAKLFGVSRAQRTIHRSDFHLGAENDPDDRDPKDLYVDVLIVLPELTDGTATPETIAPCFRHMLITRSDKAPVCRLRLEARWEDDKTAEGEVSQDLFWVDCLDAEPPDDKKTPRRARRPRACPALLHAREPKRSSPGSGEHGLARRTPASRHRVDEEDQGCG